MTQCGCARCALHVDSADEAILKQKHAHMKDLIKLQPLHPPPPPPPTSSEYTEARADVHEHESKMGKTFILKLKATEKDLDLRS